MKKAILIAVLFAFVPYYGKAKKNDHAASGNTSITGNKFSLLYQAFESHDKDGTNIDTVRNADDYILFASDGKAYMMFKGRLDSIPYYFPDKTSVSFGDTPFIITDMGDGLFRLYQNEQETNGDYNRVTYLLKKTDDSYTYFSPGNF